MDVITYALLNKKIEEGGGGSGKLPNDVVGAKVIEIPGDPIALPYDNGILKQTIYINKLSEDKMQSIWLRLQQRGYLTMYGYIGFNSRSLRIVFMPLAKIISNATKQDFVIADMSNGVFYYSTMNATLGSETVTKGWQANCPDRLEPPEEGWYYDSIINNNTWVTEENVLAILPAINLGSSVQYQYILHQYQDGQLDLSKAIYPQTTIDRIYDKNNNQPVDFINLIHNEVPRKIDIKDQNTIKYIPIKAGRASYHDTIGPEWQININAKLSKDFVINLLEEWSKKFNHDLTTELIIVSQGGGVSGHTDLRVQKYNPSSYRLWIRSVGLGGEVLDPRIIFDSEQNGWLITNSQSWDLVEDNIEHDLPQKEYDFLKFLLYSNKHPQDMNGNIIEIQPWETYQATLYKCVDNVIQDDQPVYLKTILSQIYEDDGITPVMFIDLATYATGEAGLVQGDALTILSHPETYEGKIIQFYSNTTAPAHLISYGVIIRGTDTAHTPYLIELDRDGHTIKWTQETNYDANEGITFREI